MSLASVRVFVLNAALPRTNYINHKRWDLNVVPYCYSEVVGRSCVVFVRGMENCQKSWRQYHSF